METDPLVFNQMTNHERELLMEIENYERCLNRSEKSKKSMYHSEIITRRDLYVMHTGQRYTKPLDVSKIEKDSLECLFRILQGYSWSRNAGWIGQPKTPVKLEINPFESEASLYEGVQCTTTTSNAVGTLSGLYLSGKGCIGTFPSDIYKLTNMRYINCNINLISGNFPIEMQYMSDLRKLSMCGNLLRGPLDQDALSHWTLIRFIDLSFNEFDGELPDIFGQMNHLMHLNIAGNKFTGFLPSSISSLTRLEVLKCYSNDFYGVIPSSWAHCQLRIIDLSQNRLSGGLRPLLSSPKLETLNLSNNCFTDDLTYTQDGTTIQWTKLTNLTTLYLHKNQFTSHGLPSQLYQHTSLRRLNLSHNNISGCLTKEIGCMIGLVTLLLHGNHLVGPVPAPSHMQKLTSLKDFSLFSAYPSDQPPSFTTAMPTGFHRSLYQQLYDRGPSLGLDSMHWRVENEVDEVTD